MKAIHELAAAVGLIGLTVTALTLLYFALSSVPRLFRRNPKR